MTIGAPPPSTPDFDPEYKEAFRFTAAAMKAEHDETKEHKDNLVTLRKYLDLINGQVHPMLRQLDKFVTQCHKQEGINEENGEDTCRKETALQMELQNVSSKTWSILL